MDNPHKVTRDAFIDLLFAFRAQVIPRLAGIKEWQNRTNKASTVQVAPSTMIDLANEILKRALGADSNGKADDPTNARKGAPISLNMPFAVIAIDPTATPMRGEFGRRLPVRSMRIPEDPQQRLVKVRIDQYMVRMQTVFYAADTQTAKEMAQQFVDYVQLPFQGRIYGKYRMLGTELPFKGLINDRDLLPQRVDTGLQGIHAVALDTEWRLKVPTIYDKNGKPIDEDGEGADSVDLAAGLDLVIQAIVYKEYADPETVLLEGAP